jgi:dolichol-phosphate mannosyltransferase
MGKGLLYSVILPTYNERENLPLMMSMLNKHFEQHSVDYEIVIVEDNSPDGTLAVAQALRDVYGANHVTIISRPGKMGLGSAYMDGLKKCRGDFVFLMDADMSHHPKHMVEFIAKQKSSDADIVTGTRYALGGGVAGWDLRRVVTSRGANLLANLLLTPGISDLTGSFRLYKKAVLERLMSSVKGKTYVFQMEVIVRAKQQGFSIEEVPIVFVDRIYGESKLGANEIISYIKGLWALFLDLDL